jgi:hypothetical protein
MENPETLTTLDTRHGMKARKTKTLHRKLKDEQQSPQQIESRMWTQVYEQYQWQWKNIALISYCIVQHKENVNWDVIKFYIMHSRRLPIWELQRFVYCLLCFVFVFCCFVIFVCLCFFIKCRTDDCLYNEAYIAIYIFYHNLLTIQEL